VAEREPASAASSLHDLAKAFRTIGLHDDALRAETGAAELYRPLAETPAFVRKLIISLELCAKDLRAFGRGEDAAGADAEVATLRSMDAD
jgi:hypothetical protein